jgi:hypothetical protein
LAKGKTAIDGLSGSGSEEPTTGIARRGLATDSVCLDRLGDIFDLLRTEIDELDRKFCPDVVPNSTRDANPARLRKSLQASRNIDGIAK